jgi:SAM-dependent methyltransferase
MGTGDGDDRETRAFWNRVARDWEVQVGDKGDSNRILNSDPVLWQLVGDVAGRDVLDAGCGTGYLARMLREKGARVVGVDFSERMIEIASSKDPRVDFRVESCSELASVADDSIDVVIGNYVLMDVADLHGALRAFHRVLRQGGAAVLVFSHPCFPQGRATALPDGALSYRWDFGYFDERRCVDPPWKHFQSEFIWFHRPLSHYWKAFLAAGFEVIDFDEPHITAERYALAEDERELTKSKRRPYSVAFKLRKAGA